MHGVDPYGYLQQIAGRLDRLANRTEAETLLDEVEYLYEVMDPELQPLADTVIARLRDKLKALA